LAPTEGWNRSTNQIIKGWQLNAEDHGVLVQNLVTHRAAATRLDLLAPGSNLYCMCASSMSFLSAAPLRRGTATVASRCRASLDLVERFFPPVCRSSNTSPRLFPAISRSLLTSASTACLCAAAPALIHGRRGAVAAARGSRMILILRRCGRCQPVR